ncbi:MAG: amidohydrolase family protein [Chloroflexota bacterium]
MELGITREPVRRSRRRLLAAAVGGAAGAAGIVGSRGPVAGLAATISRQDAASGAATLFRDVRIFDGVRPERSGPSSVLVREGMIATVSGGRIEPPPGSRVIDGGGATLMPGLIDAHWHTMMAEIPLAEIFSADIGYVDLIAGRGATRLLLSGFTTVRDMAGPSFGLKRAIDEGVLPGPRIYPSGAIISQTSGHGDFRKRSEVPSDGHDLSYAERVNFGVIADGSDAVLRATREQLMLGASQIKLAAGGGIISDHDPITVTEYSQPEIEAAVGAAADWGTYVTVHAFGSRAIQRALAAGVMCIDHGQLMDEATAQMIGEKDAWLSLQPFVDAPALRNPSEPNPEKAAIVSRGTDATYAYAIKYGLKVAWGTDILFSPEAAAKHGEHLAVMTRWYTPAQVLVMATSTNADLLAMSGPCNPYPGVLGRVVEGAYADLLLVDGNPLEDLTLFTTPETSLRVIMKGGEIYKG